MYIIMAYNKIVTGLVIALVIAFVALFFAAPSPMPYSKHQNYSKYEGFAEGGALPEEEVGGEGLPKEKEPGEESADPKEPEGFEPILDVPQSIDYAPFRDSVIIDKFSQVTSNGIDGVNGCVSSGLSNSGGYICLTPELIQLLKTRGGNAAGV